MFDIVSAGASLQLRFVVAFPKNVGGNPTQPNSHCYSDSAGKNDMASITP